MTKCSILILSLQAQSFRTASLPTYSIIYNISQSKQICPIKGPTQLLLVSENGGIDNYNIYTD